MEVDLAGMGTYVLGPELDIESNAVGYLAPARKLSCADTGVERQIVGLARRARTAIGDVDRHLADVTDCNPVGRVTRDTALRVARMREHGLDFTQVDDMYAAVISCARVGRDRAACHAGGVGTLAMVPDPGRQYLVSLADRSTCAAFSRHVAQRGTLVRTEHRQTGSAELHRAAQGGIGRREVPQDHEHQVLGRAVGW